MQTLSLSCGGREAVSGIPSVGYRKLLQLSMSTTTYSVKFHKWGSERITLPLGRGGRRNVFERPSARYRKLSQFSIRSSFSPFNDPLDFFIPKHQSNKSEGNKGNSDDKLISFVDEWGEKSEPELRPVTKLSDSDPPIDIDEWGTNNSSGIEDEWGEKSGPELRPEKTVSDSDPPIDEDEWIGAKIHKVMSKTTDRVKVWKSKPEPEPEEAEVVKVEDEGSEKKEESLLDSDTQEVKGERAGAKPDPTRIHTRLVPLPSLVQLPKLGKIAGGNIDRIKNEVVSSNETRSFADEQSENSEPEPLQVESLPDSDPPKDEDERIRAKPAKPDPTHIRIAPLTSLAKLGKIVGNRTDHVKNEGVSRNETTSFVDELGEKLKLEPKPIVSLPDSDPLEDKDERVEAKQAKTDPTHTHIAPLPSLTKLGKLVGEDIDRVKNEVVSINKATSFVDELGEKLELEPKPIVNLPDSDPMENKDERVGAKQAKPDPTHIAQLPSLTKLGKRAGEDIDRVNNEVVSINKAASFVDELGEKLELEPEPVVSLPDSDPPEDKDERFEAKKAKPNLTHSHIAPLSSLTKLGKLVGKDIDRVKNEVASVNKATSFVDELGEKLEPELQLVTSLLDSDPLKVVDELGVTELMGRLTAVVVQEERVAELKRSLIDTVYGTDFGLKASSEVRAEALELVAQLEAANPTPNPVESPELLDGNWILVFTAFSELLPLLAVGTIPLLKVEKISQAISTRSLTIENSTTVSSPVAALSFSATAAFEVQSPSRIQVGFKEGTLTLKPPEIMSKLLPGNMDILGQNISLLPVQQSLGPLENAAAGITQTIFGLPTVKFPIPGEWTKSWLITTYLDKDLRISRGDGGLFVLVKEESSFLEIGSKVLSRLV
ncbi:putative plastid-lipid-associated protein 3, chloroplastic [Capsicum baccatum]|uniref:Plastid-lipid-associated protein 3, chloroplastic n=1 Tax=Capsicum baccatum TaxID=33114 RepID=A0A2G2W3V6_CAPBA|nr:putative plastid-lipid-associated protein 3, chloroplastic [Capsicum baccatum]